MQGPGRGQGLMEAIFNKLDSRHAHFQVSLKCLGEGTRKVGTSVSLGRGLWRRCIDITAKAVGNPTRVTLFKACYCSARIISIIFQIELLESQLYTGYKFLCSCHSILPAFLLCTISQSLFLSLPSPCSVCVCVCYGVAHVQKTEQFSMWVFTFYLV